MHVGRLTLRGLVALAPLAASALVAAEPAQPSPSPTAGHSIHGEVFNEGPRQKAYLMGTTGNVSLVVTTRSPQASAASKGTLSAMPSFE